MYRSVCAFLTVLVCACCTLGQEVQIDLRDEPSTAYGYFHKWDNNNDRLVFYRDLTATSDPGIRWFDRTGKNVTMFPLKDFPQAQRMTFWDVAGTVGGDIVASVIVSYGPPKTHAPIKSLILTYNSSGELKSVWDVQPYHFYHVAAIKDSIFALGVKNADSSNYPTVVEYSRNGEVVREFLPAGTLPNGESTITDPSRSGSNKLLVDRDRLYLWLAGSKQLLQISPEKGGISYRVSLASQFQHSVAGEERFKSTYIDEVALKDGRLLFQLILVPSSPDQSPEKTMLSSSVSDGKVQIFPVRDVTDRALFVGITNDGKLAFLQDAATGGKWAMLRFH